MKIKIYLLLLCTLAHSAKIQAGDLDSLLKVGITQYSTGEYPKAIETFSNSILLAKKENNKKELANAYNNLGNAYSKTGESEKALNNYQLSISIAEEINDTVRIAKTNKNIGSLYSEQKDFPTALLYYTTAYDLAKKINDSILIADCLNNRGVVYEQQNKFKQAAEVYSQALTIYTLKKDEYKISISLNNLAIVYKLLKKYPESISNYETALQLAIKLGDKFNEAATLNNLGNVYVLTGEYTKSLDFCTKASEKAIEINAKEIVIEAYDGISIAYEKLGKFTEALRYRKLYEEEKYNFINSERSGQLAEMKTKYESDRQANEIALLKQNELIKNLSIRQQEIKIQNRNYLLAFILLMLLSILGVGFQWLKSSRLKSKVVQQLAVKESEEKERVRIAKDIHDELGSGLTKINFLSEMILQKQEADLSLKNKISSISETSKSLVENMRDLIWALNPENTTLDNLVTRIREYSSDYLEEFPIKLTNEFPESVINLQISKESQRNIFMAVKEALNNIVKHSHATEVNIQVHQNYETLSIFIKDNGHGIGVEGSQTGNGLKNIKHRIEIIGGTIEISNNDVKGVQVLMTLPLNNLSLV